MRSAGQIPLSRALDNARKEAAVRYSGTAANGATETISPLIFHPAFPIQPPPLRGTSFHRKEGVSTQAPSLGRGKALCRGQRCSRITAFPTRGRLKRKGASRPYIFAAKPPLKV